MNCQDFETIIIEIARHRLLDAVARERGLEHTESCAHCAALLAEEEALSLKLRTLSAEAAAEELPVHVETALLAAFPQRVAAPAVEPAATVSPKKQRWLLAVAALTLVAFGLSLAGWIALSPERDPAIISTAPRVVTPAPKIAEIPEPGGQVKPQIVAGLQTAQFITRAKPELRARHTGNNQPLLVSNERREVFTQFFPINQGSELIPLESGQIIRVRMPRSNLISLGITLNQERADETIQADVLVSNDGLARAIRLVY